MEKKFCAYEVNQKGKQGQKLLTIEAFEVAQNRSHDVGSFATKLSSCYFLAPSLRDYLHCHTFGRRLKKRDDNE